MAGNLIMAGEPGAREKRVRQIWSRTNGASYQRIWWGPHDDVEAVFNNRTTVDSAGVEGAELTPIDGSPISILTVTYSGWLVTGGGRNEASETISISYSDQTVPLNQNPTFNDITTATIQDLESKLSNHDANPYSDTTSAEYKYYALRSRKVDNYRVKLPHVVWRRSVPADYPTAADLENIGAIFSTGDLAGSIGAPILFTIPTGNVGISEDDEGLFTPGWLKDGSVDWQADGKAELILTAEFGLWANDAYYFVSSE